MMKHQLGALAAFALAACAVPAAAQTTIPVARQPARIDVSGQGSVDRMPDQVIVTFDIVANDDLAARATSAANTAYAALLARMRGLGLDAAAVKTTSYTMSYNPRPPQPNPQVQARYGYVVERSVAVTTAQTDRAGTIVDAGIAAGATSVESVSFGLHDNRAAYRDALAQAVADADAQARALAAAAHLHVVRITDLRAGSAPAPIQPLVRTFKAAADSYSVPTQLQPGALTVNATVGATYEVAP